MVRYLIKFTKEDSIKFISHLDLMRTLQKIIRRAELTMEYSRGFNPHMALSIAQPLSVGHYSIGEYMDIVLGEDVSKEDVIEKLNSNAPMGIRFLEATKIKMDYGPSEKRVPQAMALIDAALYTIKVKYDDVTKIEKEVEDLLNLNEWNIVKKSKKGEKEVNIRPLIKEINFCVKEDNLIINLLAPCGSREHLSPELFVTYIKENTSSADMDAFTYIKREEMYAEKDEELVPLYKFM